MQPIEQMVYIAGDKDLDSGLAKAIALKSIATALDQPNNIRELFVESMKAGDNPVFEALKSDQFVNINQQIMTDDIKSAIHEKVLIIDGANNPFSQVEDHILTAEFDASLNQHTLGTLNQIHVGALQELKYGLDVESALNKSIDLHVVQADTNIENEQTRMLSVGLAAQKLFSELKEDPKNITFNAMYGDAINAKDLEVGNGDIASITSYIQAEVQQSQMLDVPPQLHALSEIDAQLSNVSGVSIPVDQDRLGILAGNIEPKIIEQSYKVAIDLAESATKTVSIKNENEMDSPSM